MSEESQVSRRAALSTIAGTSGAFLFSGVAKAKKTIRFAESQLSFSVVDNPGDGEWNLLTSTVDYMNSPIIRRSGDKNIVLPERAAKEASRAVSDGKLLYSNGQYRGGTANYKSGNINCLPQSESSSVIPTSGIEGAIGVKVVMNDNGTKIVHPDGNLIVEQQSEATVTFDEITADITLEKLTEETKSADLPDHLLAKKISERADRIDLKPTVTVSDRGSIEVDW